MSRMKLIALTQGKFAMVDDADYDRLSRFKWHAVKKRGVPCYARRNTWDTVRKRGSLIYMHQMILNIPENFKPDHRDGNGLNNQRSNLRIATNTQNAQNRQHHKNNKSGFKGVVWHKRDKIYEASIRVNTVLFYIGRFAKATDAARAYDSAAIIHFGAFSKTNQQLGLLPCR